MAKSATRYGQARQFSDQAPAIGGGGTIPTIQFSSGRASALANFSRTLFGLSAQMEDQLDAQAEAEASKEGAIAGLAGDTQEQSYETIRGRAYNKAMLETFVTTFETDTMIGLERLKQQHWADPTGLEKAANDYLNGKSSELEKIAPGAGAAFRHRQSSRLLPAVESARDDRYKLTQDEANASLILHEATVLGAVKENSKNLFSANPALSQAASTAVAQTYYEYMRTYDAVDPITGKPLYSQSDKAKAQVYMRDKIMTEAAIGWFESQPDPAKAYLEMSSDDFKFNINLPGEEPGKIIYENQGKTRNRKVNQQVESWLTTAAGMLGPNVSVHVTSGGQPTQAEIASARARGQRVGGRTGSTRHDHGNAADIVLSVNGKKVTPQQNPQLYRDFAENAAAAGATGIGHYSWGIHVGGGSETVWGPDTRVASVDPAFAASVARGRTRRGSAKLMEPMNINMPLKSAMSEKAWNSLDQEMRQRINFTNQQYDRQIKQQEAETKEAQEAAAAGVTLRIYAAGQKDADGNDVLPIDAREIDELYKEGIISSSQQQAFVKAITTEKPERSDPNVYQELQRRMWNGEDVQDDLLNAELLSQTDRNALLQKNRDLRQSEGRMTAEESRQYAALGDLLKTPGMFGEIDQGQAVRAYEAQQEFIDRINARAQTGETLTDIVRDIRGRYFLDMSSYTGTQLDRIGLPRFAVTRDADARRIDVAATIKRLSDARKEGKFASDQEFYDQMRLVAEWDRLQKQLDEQQRQAENNGKGRKK